MSDLKSDLWTRVRPVLENLEDHWAEDCGLSRTAVVESATTKDGATTVDPVALLVTSMAFGYGGRPYGPDRVMKMLSTPMIEKSCSDIFEAAQLGPEKGFAALYKDKRTRVNQLSASMGSKYLYFASSSLSNRSRSLINDDNVFQAMRVLGLTEAANPKTAYTTHYIRAVAWMHDAASEINAASAGPKNISGEEVEYALFQYADWQRRRVRLAIIESRN
jgi:hypothetical protein